MKVQKIHHLADKEQIFFSQFESDTPPFRSTLSWEPCRLRTNVIVVVRLERFNDLLGYAVEPIMSDRSKVRFQTKRNTGTRLLIRRDCARSKVWFDDFH